MVIEGKKEKKKKRQQIIKQTLRGTNFLPLSQDQLQFNTSLSSFLGSGSFVFAEGYMQALPIPLVSHLVVQEVEVSNGLFPPLPASCLFSFTVLCFLFVPFLPTQARPCTMVHQR